MKNSVRFEMLFLVFFALLLAGCASTPKAEWNSRVGSYAYDQAVAELGPPDKSAKLSDGSTVAEWFIKHSSSVSFGVGTGFYSRGSSVGVGQTVGTSPAGEDLRLTVGADGKVTRGERVRP